MNSKHRRLAFSTAFILMLSLTQVYVGASFAGADPRPGSPAVTKLDLTGVLRTSGKQAVLVNGINAVTDATILSGALIESPQGVSATVNLGQLGRLDIAPATNLKLEFGIVRIRVTLIKGCVVLHTTENTIGTIETENGVVVAISAPSKEDVLDVCQQEGATTPVVNQGAAANAGAGVGGGGSSGAGSAATAGGGAASGGGLSETAGVLLGAIGGGTMIALVLILPCDRASDPSPSQNTHCRE
jgi:hypothetical protein